MLADGELKVRKYPHFLTMQILQLDFNPAWAVFKFSDFELPAAFFNFAAFSLAFAWAWIFCCPRAIIWKMTEICKFGNFWSTSWNIDSLNYLRWTISSKNLTKEACNFNKTTVYFVFWNFSFWLLLVSFTKFQRLLRKVRSKLSFISWKDNRKKSCQIITLLICMQSFQRKIKI